MKRVYCRRCGKQAGWVNTAGDYHTLAGVFQAAADIKMTIQCPHCGHQRTWGAAPPEKQPAATTKTTAGKICKRNHARIAMQDAREIRSRYYQSLHDNGGNSNCKRNPEKRISMNDLARYFNIGVATIRDIIHYRTWREQVSDVKDPPIPTSDEEEDPQ